MDWIGFITGAICVWLIVREKDINWPIGLLNSVALLVVFCKQKLYAQAGLQVFYILECAYGWWMWTRIDSTSGFKLVRIGRARQRSIQMMCVISIVGLLLFWPIFRQSGDPTPFWDSMVTVMSLVAEYMLCLKLLEAWGLYLLADLISLVIFAVLALADRSMWITFGTYVCFTALCVMGILEWRKRMKNHSAPVSSLASSTL
jgi:nicotinamide mononucleotide transporter